MDEISGVSLEDLQGFIECKSSQSHVDPVVLHDSFYLSYVPWGILASHMLIIQQRKFFWAVLLHQLAS